MEQSYKDLQARYIFNFVFNISGIDVNGVTAFCKYVTNIFMSLFKHLEKFSISCFWNGGQIHYKNKIMAPTIY